ncbi:MAG: VOC family protein [Methanomassiliicoccales archaeon]
MTLNEDRIIYRHTNLVARDWRLLADFYVRVFGCQPVFPERNLAGDWLDGATGLTNAHIRGIHLMLPGYGEDGPTLEIFQYDANISRTQPVMANREGIGHIAFSVRSVANMLVRVKEHGGDSLGDVVQTEVVGVGTLVMVYALDPEGNIIELQSWI